MPAESILPGSSGCLINPCKPYVIKVSENALVSFGGLFPFYDSNRALSIGTKNPEALFFKASGFCGISRTRTYDPHDVNVVL